MSVYEQLPAHSSLAGIWRGSVATDASGMNDTIYVLITAFDDTHRFGPCRWMPRDAVQLPLRGDECLVVFDEKDIPYVIMWW